MHIEAAYVKFQNQPYKIVLDPNNMDDIKLGIHTVQAEVNAWCQDFTPFTARVCVIWNLINEYGPLSIP